MKISIIGAGFAGLALSWYLLNQIKNLELTLYDESGIGSGASGVSAGLLHPFTGFTAKLNKDGFEAYETSLELLQVSSDELKKNVFTKSGLIRFPVNEKQKNDFIICANKHAMRAHWLTSQECSNYTANTLQREGLYLEDALSINSLEYLQGLYQACKKMGLQFVQRKIDKLSDLYKDNDYLLFAGGAGFYQFNEYKNLPLRRLKGQILILPWPEGMNPLKVAISSNIYLICSQNKKYCYVGSTYERDFDSDAPEISVASAKILPLLEDLYPPLKNVVPIDCKAGIRVTSTDHYPFIKRISKKEFILTGLGSKGLLYHAYMAKKLIQMMLHL